jgi:parallel beta-helix repeat protein
MGKKYGTLIICAAILVLCFVGTASARTWYVDDDGGADFIKIHDAINNATDGDTIIVRDGHYIENIKVNKTLTIQSENGSDKTFVTAEDSKDDAFLVTANYANVSGFTVNMRSICLYYADHCNISNNNCGITLKYSNNNRISNNICLYNSYDGVYLLHSNNNSIFNNTCSYNDALFQKGIYLSSSNNNSIANNTCSNNSEGIRLASSSRNTIIDNKVIYNEGFGIIFVSSSGIYDFVKIGSDYNIIKSNTVTSNNGDGICIAHSSSNIVKENNVKHNEIGISILAYPWFKFYWLDYSSMDNEIYLNNFINNTNNFFSESPLNSWNSIKHITYHYNSINFTNYLGNYWSDYTGSDTDGDGIGDMPYNISGFTRTSKFFSDSDDYPLVKPFENYLLKPSSHEVNAYSYLYEVMDKYDEFFDVYTDRDVAGNHYIPSSWVGDWDDITFNGSYTSDPHSGANCIKINYSANGSQGNNWSGIYWQDPENNCTITSEIFEVNQQQFPEHLNIEKSYS